MILPTRLLKKWIKKITNTNSKRILFVGYDSSLLSNIPVKSILASNESEILGVNTLHQKSMVERIFNLN